MPPKSGHQRAKNIDYDDGNFYSGDEYSEEESGAATDEMTDEDREQMKIGTAKVREALDTSLNITDAQIQEALWHYYYDVGKSVTYLKNKFAPKPQAQPKAKATSRFDQAAGTGNPPTGKQIPDESIRLAPCLGQNFGFEVLYTEAPPDELCTQEMPTTSGFFWDTPWGMVPPHRLGNLTPVHPIGYKGGLLGGSKLQALAAKRKQKEAMDTRITSPDADKAVSLLDKLSFKDSKPATRNHEQSAHAKYPSRKRSTPSEDAPPNPTSDPAPEPETEPAKPVVEFPDLRAQPSMFGATLCGLTEEHREAEVLTSFPLPYTTLEAFRKANPFDGPSPDDIVRQAQARGTPKPKTTPKKTHGHGDKLAESVDKLAVADDTSRVKSKNLNVVEEFEKSGMKRIANFVVIGHVDHGKSTLMGRLLYDLKVIDQRSVDKLRKEAETIGKSSFALAWIMDSTSEERTRGVTVDIAMEHFETSRTRFTILDAPGHRDFVPKMIAGASQADFALLVIDANANSFESGLRGQTKEHALLVRSMGVKSIIVAVNKMDTVHWNQARFVAVCNEMTAFFTSASFLPKHITFVACAGLTGDNVTKRTEDPRASWYTSKTLLDALESVEPAKRLIEKPLRLTIGDVFRGGITNPISISGRIDAGSVQVGDIVLAMPSNETATIKAIEIEHETVDWAVAGQIPTLHLTDIDPIHLRLGDIVCDPKNPVKLVKTFTSKLLAFEHVLPGTMDIFRGQLWVEGKITKLSAKLDKFKGDVVKKKPRIIKPGEVARVVVELEKELPLENGVRIVMREGGKTVAAGLLEG
ncbi:hypothetical protein K458DRAFT_393577 [Lentithecium fluviatile CBS 122367]|uniref:Elongation factor 1 alpha-like protein n=1 Tax=Lentithecium fluviatile CBS 122367 TaxID=1168545 RepID=A0A6G1IND8_9PLEO|nr:hypothetical protein K458DRAFT_393577 [Lentithecium fluviatile CBS 122367]